MSVKLVSLNTNTAVIVNLTLCLSGTQARTQEHHMAACCRPLQAKVSSQSTTTHRVQSDPWHCRWEERKPHLLLLAKATPVVPPLTTSCLTLTTPEVSISCCCVSTVTGSFLGMINRPRGAWSLL